MKPNYKAPLVLLAAVLLLSGCAAPAPATPESLPLKPAPSVSSSSSSSSSSKEDVPVNPNQEPLSVADAARYRGTLTSVDTALDGQALYRLEAASGTGLAPMLLAVLDENTKASFDLATLAVGDHLEVYYGVPMGGGLPGGGASASSCDLDPHTIIALNRILSADSVYYNGVLKESTLKEDGTLDLVMEPLPEDKDPMFSQFVFHCSPDTQLYLDKAKLVPGARLNIYHKGIATRSIPPQGVALEVQMWRGPDGKEKGAALD